MNINHTDKPYVIGLDLGGTNSVFGIVDKEGNIKASTSIKTKGFENAEDYLKASLDALSKIIEETGGINNIYAMGIGAPNANYYNGTIENAPNLDWAKGTVPLAKMFSDALGIPVAMTNDANAAAIGEMAYGVARGMKNFIVITLGTGVGSGIVINGQLVYGSDGFAGELGHVTMVRTDGRNVVVAVADALRHTAQQQALRELHAKCSRTLILHHYCVKSHLRASHHLM